MYFSSVITLLFVALYNTEANPCNGGFCLPKHLCPTGKIEDVATMKRNDRLTLQVDEENECGDFMKICCKGSTSSFDSIPTLSHDVAKGDYKCGMVNPDGLVYDVKSNLTYAKYAEFPWTVAILKMSNGFELTYVGGGALIHPKFVLTGAQTLEKPHQYVARFGEWNMKSDAEFYPSQDIGIKEHILHPSYTAPSFRNNDRPENDIALAVLKQSVIYTEHIQPICLPTNQNALNAQNANHCIATGWGMDSRTEETATIMKRLEVKAADFSRCSLMHAFEQGNAYFILHHSSLCAGPAAGQKPCVLDGGTPMACPQDDGSYVLIGITSSGLGCGNPFAPGVYVDVPMFASWINDTIAGYEELHAEE